MRKMLAFAGFLILFAGGCAERPGTGESPVVKALVSIPPQKQFVKAVAGPAASVHVLVPPGASPATYDPKPADLIRVEEADIYFRIGYIGFERSHLSKLRSLNPGMMVVDTSEGVALRTLSPLYDHAEGIDPHIWLSPPAVKIQVATIARGLADVDPVRREDYLRNAESYMAELDALHGELEEMFARLPSKTLLVFHPAWGYFADAYGLKQLSIEQEGKDPSPEQLRRILDSARAARVSVVFVQREFSRELARSIAEQIGGAVIAIDPLAEDYIANLRSVARTIFEHLNTKG
jgi:zinc transport system substrate-binding protein